MPRPKAGSPIFKRMRAKGWEVTRELPDVERIFDRAGRAGATIGYLGAEYAFDGNNVYQEASQMALGGVLQNVGMPVADLYRETLDIMNVDVVGEVGTALRKGYDSIEKAISSAAQAGDSAGYGGGEAMRTAVDAGVGSAVTGVSWVPIAGWIIKAAWGLGKAMRTIVSLAKTSRDYGKVERQYRATRFDPTFDRKVINQLIRTVRFERDWSRAFAPPSIGRGLGTTPNWAFYNIETGGWELMRKAGNDPRGLERDWLSEGFMGFVAGSEYIVRGVSIVGDNASIIGPQLLPSAQRVLIWLWSSIMGSKGNAGPNMYCVDADFVGGYWSEYIGDLHQFIYDTDRLSTARKDAIMRSLNADAAGNKIFNWGTDPKPKSNEWDNYRPVKQANALGKRQSSFLDTLLCAYVDESFAAIKESKTLKKKWLKRRKQLLTHPARCEVDLDNVPDGEYRRALIDSGARNPTACYSQTLSIQLRTGPSFKTAKGAPDANTKKRRPKKKKTPAERAFATGFVPFLALSAGAYYAYRRGYFKGLPVIG